MKRVIKIRTGESVPNEAKFLESKREYDYSRQNYRTKVVRGLFFNKEYIYEIIPQETFHYYEIEEK